MNLLQLSILVTVVYGRNFRNSKLDDLPEEKLLDALCASFQQEEASHKLPFGCTAYVSPCRTHVNNISLSDFNITQNSLFTPKLLCKEDDVLNLYWINEGNYVYFLQFLNTKTDIDVATSLTTCRGSTVVNLNESTIYNIRLWATSFKEKTIFYSDFLTVTTANSGSTPAPLTNIYLKKINYEADALEAIIEWSPNTDYSCQFDLVWLDHNGSIIEERINVISDSYQTTLKNLGFGSDYTLNMRAISGKSLHESPTKSFSFSTKTCLQVYSSLDRCPPDQPTGMMISKTRSTGQSYNVKLSWQKPSLSPLYYIVDLVNSIGQNRIQKSLNVSGSQTSATFESVELGYVYLVVLQACSLAGCSEKIAEEAYSTMEPNESSNAQIWNIVISTSALVLVILTGIVLVRFYKMKNQRKVHNELYKGIDKFPETPPDLEINFIKNEDHDNWEIDAKNLLFQKVIGEGAFGVVRIAYLKTKDSSQTQVAVKMLKESTNTEEIRQFTQEINIMKSVGKHPYIVSLIGCVTKHHIQGPLLIVEYCSRGNLETYLRNAWYKFNSLHQEYINDDESINADQNYFSNKIYDFQKLHFEDEFILQPKHLLSIARQVALGMEHLSKTRVVHRDLAARNVLVCENHTVKVSDFGLSRDVYQDSVYNKGPGGKVPVKWMALESLTHQRYTTQSDVWSYGILLWEIVTLGGTPYVGIHNSNLLEYLKNGNRLPRPSNCSSELYAMMLSCWKAYPQNRPTFTEICKLLEDFLENVSDYLQLDNSDSTETEVVNTNEQYISTVSL